MLSDHEKESLFLDFQMISVSAVQRLRQISESRTALSILRLAYFQFQEVCWEAKSCTAQACRTVFATLDSVEPDAVHLLDKEDRRLSVLASVTILDTFLSDLLRFLFVVKPELMPEKYVSRAQEDLDEAVDRYVREKSFGGYRRRFDYIEEVFQTKVDGLEGLIPQIQELADLRNEIAHDSALYRCSHDPAIGKLLSSPRPIPEVPFRTALNASMLVAEVIDAIFVAISRSYFGREPSVRPLTPEVVAVHERLRVEWATREESSEADLEVLSPGWEVRESEDEESGRVRYWITDTDLSFIIQPTGIERMPIMVSYARHNYHGKSSHIIIDDHEPVCLDSSGIGSSKTLLNWLFHGKNFFVEYYQWPFEGVKRARGSLAGFTEVWTEADSKTPRVEEGTSE